MSNYIDRSERRKREDTTLHKALVELGGKTDPGPAWQAILALLRGGWPGQMTEAECIAWPAFLGDLPAETVAAAIREIHASGMRFRPRPSEVRARLAPDGAGAQLPAERTPGFDTAWSYICRAGIRNGYDPTLADKWLERHAHDSARAWARIRGLEALWRKNINCPDRGHLVRRDLRADWDRHAADWSDPQMRPSIERIAMTRPAERTKTLGPTKVDPAKLLAPAT